MKKILSLFSLLLILSFSTTAFAASHEKAEEAKVEEVKLDADGKPIKKKEEAEEEEPECD